MRASGRVLQPYCVRQREQREVCENHCVTVPSPRAALTGRNSLSFAPDTPTEAKPRADRASQATRHHGADTSNTLPGAHPGKYFGTTALCIW